jgi:hypothetical protein
VLALAAGAGAVGLWVARIQPLAIPVGVLALGSAWAFVDNQFIYRSRLPRADDSPPGGG